MAAKKKWLDCFVPHRLEMMLHPTWRLAPVPLRRMLERIEVEHLRHGGFKNGELYVSWNQFVIASISRRKITPLNDLGEALGLLKVIRAEDATYDLRAPNAYRLTYLPSAKNAAPTDEWKSVTEDRVKALVKAFRELERGSPKARARAA